MIFPKSKPIMSLLWNKLEAIFIDVGRVIWIYLIFLFSESYKLSFYCINIDSYKNKLSFLGWYLLQFMSSLSYSLPTLPNTMIGLYGFHDEWSLWLPWSNQKQVILFIMWFPSRVHGGVMFMRELFVFRRHNQFLYFIIWADINLNSIFQYFISSFDVFCLVLLYAR
jgi:hypothetical protein